MKKKILLPSFMVIITLALLISTSAFKTHPKKAVTQKAWFSYHGSQGNELNEENYMYEENEPCTGSGAFCSVYADVLNDSGDESEWLPDPDNLSALQTISSGFTIEKTVTEGSVRLQP